MSGIFGQIGNHDLSPAQLAAALAVAEQHLSHQRSAQAVLAAGSHVGRYGCARCDAVSVAFEGDIRFDHPTLSQLEREHGSAMAIALGYQQLGIELLKHCNGSFALAIHDELAGKLVAAIDRLGIKRLCYRPTADGIRLASQATGLFDSHTPEMSHQGLFDYLYFHMVPSPDCIYEGVQKLMPGEYLVFETGRISTGTYWQLGFQDESVQDIYQLAQEFRHQIERSVARYANRPGIGAFLSGGTDSSTMAGMLARLSGQKAKTFSIGFHADGYDETEYALITARHFDTDHNTYYVTPQDVVDAIPRIAAGYDEPFGNSSAVPVYFCARFAHEHGIQTMIAGDGGDELFAGNARYAKQRVFEHYQRIPSGVRSAMIEPAARIIPADCKITPLRKLRSYIDQARVPLPDRLESYNFMHRFPVTDIFSADFLATVDPTHPLHLQQQVYHAAHTDHYVNRMLHLDFKFTLADNDLRKVNQMCELGGVDVCYPLLSDEIVEFSGRVPVSMKLKGTELRYFFKYALKDFLARETLNKSKHGFGLPFGLWLHDYAPLHDLARESLKQLQQRHLLKPGFIDTLWRLHSDSHASYYGVMIWVLMMLEQWLQHHRTQ